MLLFYVYFIILFLKLWRKRFWNNSNIILQFSIRNTYEHILTVSYLSLTCWYPRSYVTFSLRRLWRPVRPTYKHQPRKLSSEKVYSLKKLAADSQSYNVATLKTTSQFEGSVLLWSSWTNPRYWNSIAWLWNSHIIWC